MPSTAGGIIINLTHPAGTMFRHIPFRVIITSLITGRFTEAPCRAPYRPVFGLRIQVLPFGYSRIVVGPDPYYYHQGIDYRPFNGGGYEVVAPPLQATVNDLTANAAVTVIDRQKYYQAGGTFYHEEISENNILRYRVVGTDGVLETEHATDDLHAHDDAIPTPGSR